MTTIFRAALVLMTLMGIAGGRLVPLRAGAQEDPPVRRREPDAPRLLSPAEVERGLALRRRAMERRRAHAEARGAGPVPDRRIPPPPAEAPALPRPDAPGGELHPPPDPGP